MLKSFFIKGIPPFINGIEIKDIPKTCAITGKNGTGKSRLLANINWQLKLLKQCTRIPEEWVGVEFKIEIDDTTYHLKIEKEQITETVPGVFYFKAGKGYVIEGDHKKEYQLASPRALAAPALSGLRKYDPVLFSVKWYLYSWSTYNWQYKYDFNDLEYYLEKIKKKTPWRFKTIQKKMMEWLNVSLVFTKKRRYGRSYINGFKKYHTGALNILSLLICLHSDYDLLLIEHPEVGLSKEMQRTLLKYFKRMRKQIIFTTHSEHMLTDEYYVMSREGDDFSICKKG